MKSTVPWPVNILYSDAIGRKVYFGPCLQLNKGGFFFRWMPLRVLFILPLFPHPSLCRV